VVELVVFAGWLNDLGRVMATGFVTEEVKVRLNEARV
jgi:hypothetical protein